MRRLSILGGVTMALVAVVACAQSDDSSDSQPPPPGPEEQPTIPDAGPQSSDEADGGSDATVDASGLECSADGWCETLLPTSDLVLRDIWPLADRAFAIAESRTLGIKILEWTSVDSTWRFIDDNSQNESLADIGVKIWAPNADEVYFVVAPAAVFHGKRPVAPATEWTWESAKLADNNPSVSPADDAQRRMTLGIWGTGSDDVYAWYSNTIFRRKSVAGGAHEWIADLVADDVGAADEYVFFTGGAGTQPGNVWFSGIRAQPFNGTCTVVVRKAAEGYDRIADGIPTGYWTPCASRDGVPLLVPGTDNPSLYPLAAWPLQFQSTDGQRFFALKPPNEILQIAPDGEGYSMSTAVVPGSIVNQPTWSSVWGESADRLWMAGTTDPSTSWGIVLRGDQVWGEAGSYEFSSFALNGVPTRQAPTQIRGTGSTNLWAVGNGYALHKTTP